MLYEYLIKNKNGDTLASLKGARNRKFDTILYKPGSASFDISVHDQDIDLNSLQTGSKELYIYREGSLVWGGELGISRITLRGDQENITVSAKGFLNLLDKRVIGDPATPVIYLNTDLYDITDEILALAQTGLNMDLGFVMGDPVTTRNADRSFNGRTLREEIEGMSNLNIQDGYDFEVTPDKKLNIFYPSKGRQLSGIVFEYGVNMTELSLSEDATDMANQIIVLGSGEGSSKTIVTVDSDQVLQDNYKVRQKAISYTNSSDENTLADYGVRNLIQTQIQKQILTVTTKGDLKPSFGEYQTGDYLRVIAKKGVLSIDGYYRLYGIKVELSDEDEETIDLIFNPI